MRSDTFSVHNKQHPSVPSNFNIRRHKSFEFQTAAPLASSTFTQTPCLRKISHSLIHSESFLLGFKRFSRVGQVIPRAARSVRQAAGTH